MCMSMRGVSKQGALTASTCFLGAFATDADRRLEFLVSARGGACDVPALRAQAAAEPPAALGAGGGCCDKRGGDDAKGATGGARRPDR